MKCRVWEPGKATWCRCLATHRITTLGGGRRRTVVIIVPSAHPLYCLRHAVERARELRDWKGYRLGFRDEAEAQISCLNR